MDPLNTIGPGVEVVKCACAPVVRRVGYLWNLDKNMNLLSLKTQLLIAKDSDLRNDIKIAELQGKVARDHVSALLEQAAKVIDQVNEITASLEETKKHFFNCCSRLRLAKRGVEVTQEVDRLLGETSQFANELIVDQLSPKADLLVAPPLVGKSTTEKNLETILAALRDPDIGKIGVYGMGGSGKTTTMMNINNHLATTDDFDKIIWVTVSKDFNLDQVQNNVAEKLSLGLSTISDQVHRASQLSKRLKRFKKVLVIFDDVWNRIPLEKVGIPEPDTDNQCKILLTTRSLAVCGDMETHKNVKLELLSKEEAWELFVIKAGNQVLTPRVKPFAEQVVGECARLPLGIITVGRALRGEDNIGVWRKAVKDLRSSRTEIRGMEEDVFKLLQFSYDHLKNNTVQNCFLYLALFPEDYKIETEELIMYWRAEDFITEEEDLETEMDEGYEIMKELLDACMFESVGGKTDRIRMHDLLRDLGIKIMGEAGGVLVKAGLGLRELPKKNEWHQARRISFMQNKIEVLHNQPNCPNLSTLLLQGNPLSQNISSSFFTQMPSLQILDLSHTMVSELPSSLSDLVELRALFIQFCQNLKRIPTLAKLEKLRVLNLRQSGIKELPQGMEGLISLRSLDISFTKQLEKCVIPKLPLLQELLMEKSKFFRMDSLAVTNCIKEISCLTSLGMLTLSFSRMDDYVNALTCLHCEMLKSFFIQIWVDKFLYYRDPYRPSALPKSVFMENQEVYSHPSNFLLPPNTQQLRLTQCRIPRLSRLLSNVRFLSKCVIEKCSIVSMESSIVEEEKEELTFTSLEELIFNVVEGINDMWKGIAVPLAFRNLRFLKLYKCNGLKNVFFVKFQHLNNIEEIDIWGCEEMEEIAWHESDSTILLPKLHTLILQDLPKLHTISGNMWVCPSLRKIHVWKCPEVKKLCLSVDNLSNLEEIKGQTEWWEALEWDDTRTRTLLQPRFENPEAYEERRRRQWVSNMVSSRFFGI